MTGARFAQEVKAKLNRLDSAAYEDVRNEEIYFFGFDALKGLTLNYDNEFDKGMHRGDRLLQAYLSSLIVRKEENLVDNKVALFDEILKIKAIAVYVTLGSGDTLEEGWQPTRTESTLDRDKGIYNMFTKSYPDMPVYKLLDNTLEFEADGFVCSKIKYSYLKYPEAITQSTELDMHFVTELQDRTVTLILENLESRRIQTQPAVSRS